MSKPENILKANDVLPMSATTKAKIGKAADALKEKALFTDKVALAKKTLGGLPTPPASH